MLIPALFATFVLGLDLNDPVVPKKESIPHQSAPETSNLAAEIADLRAQVAEIREFVGKSAANDVKFELLGREIADLRAETQKALVRTPPAPEKPKLWYLTDSSGKEWQDTDPENLKRWVRQQNKKAATPKFTAYRTYDELAFPPQSTAAFQPAPPPPLTPMTVAPAPPVYYEMPSYGTTSGTWSTPSYGVSYGNTTSFGGFSGGGILGGLFSGGGCAGGSCR